MKNDRILAAKQIQHLKAFHNLGSQGAELSKINRKYDKRICRFSMNNLKTADKQITISNNKCKYDDNLIVNNSVAFNGAKTLIPHIVLKYALGVLPANFLVEVEIIKLSIVFVNVRKLQLQVTYKLLR